MMSSNILSRFRSPTDPAAASIYETIRQHDEDSTDSDLEDHVAIALDDQTIQESYRDLEDGRLTGASRRPDRSTDGPSQNGFVQQQSRAGKHSRRPRSSSMRKPLGDVEELDDDVPASLLIEGPDERPNLEMPAIAPRANVTEPSQRHQTQWDRMQEAHQLHPESRTSPRGNMPTSHFTVLATADPKEKAMWRWANVENLDNFLADVYDYYLMHGFWSIILRRVFNLLTVAFIIGFSLFLTQCIDYRMIRGSTEMSDILVQNCTAKMGFIPNATLWITTFLCISKTFQYVLDLRRLRNLHNFFLYLLDVPESEIQSISWQEVVSRLMALRDSNPNIRTNSKQRARRFQGTQSKQRMDAHDIANRLMRKDNYMIAMINKDILDTTLPLPLLGNRRVFTRTLQWHLNQCIMDFVFNPQGQVRQLFLKDTHRKALSEGLRRRFVFAGATSLIFAPFLIVYFLIQNFFQHFNEYQKEPAQIGSRQYNVFAQWKFREFNELWHLFDRRLKMSHPFAARYINQFPKDKAVQAARFTTFVSGAIVSVLGLATILDKENFLSFEITPGRTTIFYLTIFGTIWAVARGMLPDDHMVYDSSYSMEEVIEFTHYRPAHWDGRLHTVEVKDEFAALYQMQIVILLEEMMSIVFTPFILWFSLPKCSDRIIDFFREFTVHVDGLGYVCSFAEFNFKNPGQIGTGGNAGTRAPAPTSVTDANAVRDTYFASKDNKLEQSYWGFMNDYARNPKTDVRFSYGAHVRRRPFNMPPPFPGILSPNLQAAADDGGNVARQSVVFSPKRATEGHMGTPKFGGRGEPGSPLQSLLLDPHHMPTTAVSLSITSPHALKPRTVGAAKGRFSSAKSAGFGLTTALREDDENIPQTVDGQGVEDKLAATQPGQHSGADLGSWKYAETDDSQSEEEEDVRELAEGGGAGVLGLIRQFQKVQGEDKRGGGVGV